MCLPTNTNPRGIQQFRTEESSTIPTTTVAPALSPATMSEVPRDGGKSFILYGVREDDSFLQRRATVRVSPTDRSPTVGNVHPDEYREVVQYVAEWVARFQTAPSGARQCCLPRFRDSQPFYLPMLDQGQSNNVREGRHEDGKRTFRATIFAVIPRRQFSVYLVFHSVHTHTETGPLTRWLIYVDDRINEEIPADRVQLPNNDLYAEVLDGILNEINAWNDAHAKHEGVRPRGPFVSVPVAHGNYCETNTDASFYQPITPELVMPKCRRR